MAVNYPSSLDTILRPAAVLAGLPKHSDLDINHAEAIEALEATVGTKSESNLIQRFPSDTARNAAIPSPTVGMLCSVAGVLQQAQSTSQSGWKPVAHAPTVVTTGFTSQPNWTIDNFTLLKYGPHRHLTVNFTRKTSTLTANASGNIVNEPVCLIGETSTLATQYAPALSTSGYGPNISGSLDHQSGTVYLTAVPPNVDITVSYQLSLSGGWIHVD